MEYVSSYYCAYGTANTCPATIPTSVESSTAVFLGVSLRDCEKGGRREKERARRKKERETESRWLMNFVVVLVLKFTDALLRYI
jgi:hypothetical protein